MALTQISTAGVKDDAVTSGKIPADAIGSSEIAANAVGSSELADNAVDTAAIVDDAVTADKIANSINTAIAANTAKNTNATHTGDVTGSGALTIANNAVTEAKIANYSVTGFKLGTNSVSTTKIADEAVTLAKLPHGDGSSDGKFLRANNGADPTFEEVISVGQAHNLVINGNFKVAQRATSHGSSGYRTVDRWKMSAGGASAALTQSQYSAISGTSPYAEGHHQAFRIENAGQNANTQGYVYMLQNIEAQDIVNSGWNYKSSSSYITLSFWIRGSVTQTYLINLMTNDGTVREWSHLVSLTGDDWTKVTMTVPGDSNITMNDDNGTGLALYFYAYLGDHYTSGSTVDQWVNHSGYNSRPDMGAGWWTTSNSTLMLTGVQLEAGNTASNFAHESYAETLAKCKRYYQRSSDSANGTNYSLEANSYHSADGVHSFCKHNQYYDFHVFFECEMRVPPTFTIYGSSNEGDIHIEQVGVGSSQVDWNNNTTNIQTKGFFLRHIEDSYGTSGSGNGFGIFAYTLDAEL